MSPELLAILCGIALSIITALISIGLIFRFKREIYQFGDELVAGFTEIFANPAMKTTMSMIGQKGGEAKAEKTLMDEMANDMLDTPQFAAIKFGAEQLGFDLDAYIEKHGAVKTFKAAQGLASQFGIDLMNIDLSSLAGGIGGGGNRQGGNPYLGK